MITRSMADGGNGSRLSDLPLEQALFDIEDLLERVLVPFILLGKTAESIKKGKLEGEGIEVGVRTLDLNRNAKNTLDSFTLQDKKEDEKGFTYTAHGVPVKVKYITRKFKFLENPDVVFFGPTQYRVPNPMDAYLKSQHFVW